MRDVALLFLEKKDQRKSQLALALKTSEGQRVPINRLVKSYGVTRKTIIDDVTELQADIQQVAQ